MIRKLEEGKLIGNERGYAFFVPENKTGVDYFVSHSDLKGAMHGDFVLAETVQTAEGRNTARVLKIIKRGIPELVGTYYSGKRGGIVVPDDNKFFTNVFIPFSKGARAVSGEKVVCKILSYPKKQAPEGLIKKVLGKQGDKKTQQKCIEFTYQLQTEFPLSTIEHAKSLKNVTEKDLSGRKDLRTKTIFTIDGEDARDFDDAVSLEILPDGNYLLGVHIADVSHYVRPNDEIDVQAYERATSVYFPEKVIPMLPDRLCNDLCSLVEGEDRLTLSCIITIDKNGKVVDREITPSVINSKARLTYEKVSLMLDGDEKLCKRYAFLLDDLKKMNDLAILLGKVREDKGSIDLDVKESAITVDKKGEIRVERLVRDNSHKLIEEFMILANVTVAEYIYFLEQPLIYRNHAHPSEEKLETFYAFLSGLGVKFKRPKGKVYSKDFQTILNQTKSTNYFTVINRVMLRSMQKAYYGEECIGHFGLSEERYCHFTSPIRRYPDLVVHRIVKDFISGELELQEKYTGFLEQASKQSSEKERNAIEAERAMDDYYKMLYLYDYIDSEFDAVISGVTSFGLFAELDNGIEGLIKIEELKGGRYKLDKGNFTLSNGKKTYKLGQEIKIKVKYVCAENAKAEFTIID